MSNCNTGSMLWKLWTSANLITQMLLVSEVQRGCYGIRNAWMAV